MLHAPMALLVCTVLASQEPPTEDNLVLLQPFVSL